MQRKKIELFREIPLYSCSLSCRGRNSISREISGEVSQQSLIEIMGSAMNIINLIRNTGNFILFKSFQLWISSRKSRKMVIHKTELLSLTNIVSSFWIGLLKPMAHRKFWDAIILSRHLSKCARIRRLHYFIMLQFICNY